jgi:TRAP-type C4-dicarboxylate transport system permease large subunit
VAKISLDQIVKYLVPFVLVVLGCLMVITYVPVISLGLRDLVYAPAAVAPSVAPAPAIGPQ